MKRLTPNPNPNAEVWFPEDGVDYRTAASLEPAAQALLDRLEALSPFVYAPLRDRASYAYEFDVYGDWVVHRNGVYNVTTGATMALPADITTNRMVRFDQNTGRLYLVYEKTSGVYLRYSDNYGATWSAPVTIVSGVGINGVGILDVQPGGQRIVVTLAIPSATVYISLNGGTTWTKWTAPVDAVMAGWHNNILVVVNDAGDAYASDNGATWTSLGSVGRVSTPNRFSTYRRGGKLYIGDTLTYFDGRGLAVDAPRKPGLSGYVAVNGRIWYYDPNVGVFMTDTGVVVAAFSATYLIISSRASIPSANVLTRF